MSFNPITSLQSTDTFQTLFTRNNEVISRINSLKIGGISAGTGIIINGPNNQGGITLTVDFSQGTGISGNTVITINGNVPTGLGLNSPIGITGGVLGACSTSSLTSCRNFLGFISDIAASSYKITSSGKVFNSSLSENTLYYLNTTGGITPTRPTANNSIIKPVLFNINSTSGAIVLQQNETLIDIASSTYIQSSSRNIAQIPSNGLVLGDTVYFDIASNQWKKAQANNAETSEVFGIIESISGSTASVITNGSITTIPAGKLNNLGSGGEGGNDIWFLSPTIPGSLQNQGATLAGHIVKPVFYQFPHTTEGIAYTGYVVNYSGYFAGGSAAGGVAGGGGGVTKIIAGTNITVQPSSGLGEVTISASGEGGGGGGSITTIQAGSGIQVTDGTGPTVTISTSESNLIRIGELKQVAYHGANRFVFKNWLSSVIKASEGVQTKAENCVWLTSFPCDFRIRPDNNYTQFLGITFEANQLTQAPLPSVHRLTDSNYIAMDGTLYLAENPWTPITNVWKDEFSNALLSTGNTFSVRDDIFTNLPFQGDGSDNTTTGKGRTYESGRYPLELLWNSGVNSIARVQPNINEEDPIDTNNIGGDLSGGSVNTTSRWRRLIQLWFTQNDPEGNAWPLINWANVRAIYSDEFNALLGNTLILPGSEGESEMGDIQDPLVNPGASNDWPGAGIELTTFRSSMGGETNPNYRKFKKELLTSFYLPGFMFQPRTYIGDTSSFNSEDSPTSPEEKIKTNSEDGTIDLYSNWMIHNALQDVHADWQKIGFIIPRQGREKTSNSETLVDVPLAQRRGGLYFYSPYYCITEGIWDLDKVNVHNFFKNVSNPQVPPALLNTPKAMQWHIRVGDNTVDNSRKVFLFQPTWVQLIAGLNGIHCPDWSNPIRSAQEDFAAPLPRTLMRLF